MTNEPHAARLPTAEATEYMISNLKSLRLAGLLASAGLFPWLPGASQATVALHVATTGSDTADGSASRPFATPARGQQAARAAVGRQPGAEVTVWLHGGTYELAAPLVFGPEDSSESSVTYRAWPGEQVILSGGQRLSGVPLLGARLAG